MAAARLCLRAAVVVGLVPAARGWNPTCDGDFVCSSITSSDPELYTVVPGRGASNTIVCKYGHTEVDGTCERPCEGGRSAPCRCQTQEEAKDSIFGGALTSVIVSGVAFLIGICCTLCACRSARKVQATLHETNFRNDGENAQVDAQDAAVEEGSAAGVQGALQDAGTAGAAEDAGAPAPSSAAAPQGETSPASTAASTATSPSGGGGSPTGFLARLAIRSREKAAENPAKFKLLRWFFPLISCAGAAFLTYWLLKDMKDPDNFYKHLGDTLGIFAIVCAGLSLLVVVRAAMADNLLLCIGRICGALCCLIPVLSLAGIVWSVIKMIQAGDAYHSCEVHRCIWHAC